MKTVICTKYGPPEVLQLREVEKPVPRNNEVLIRVHASTVTMGDCELRNLSLPLWTRIPTRLYFGYGKPRNFTPGMEFSGVIESVGKNVKTYKTSDPVFGTSGMRMGANAEYICIPATYPMAIKPAGLSHEKATTITVGGINALHFLRKANIQPGQKVLVIGAGGSIGTYGVKLAKFYGADVTAVDKTEKLEMLREIGADHVIDYTKEDFSENGEKYDVIFDMVYKSSYSKCIRSLKKEGCYLMANTGPLRMLRGLWLSKTSKKRAVSELAAVKPEDLQYLAELISTGKIETVIDKIYPQEKIVEAHEYVEKGHKKGSIVLTMEDNDQ